MLLAWWLFIGSGSAMVLFDPAFVSLQQWFPCPMRNRAAATLMLITGLAGPIFIPSTLYLVEGLGRCPTAALRWRMPRGCIPMSLSVALMMVLLEAYNIHRIARFEAEGFNPEALAW